MMRKSYIIGFIIFIILDLVKFAVKKESLKSILDALSKTCSCITIWFFLFGQ